MLNLWFLSLFQGPGIANLHLPILLANRIYYKVWALPNQAQLAIFVEKWVTLPLIASIAWTLRIKDVIPVNAYLPWSPFINSLYFGLSILILVSHTMFLRIWITFLFMLLIMDLTQFNLVLG